VSGSHANIARLVAQAALTDELMGVDFMPVKRRERSALDSSPILTTAAAQFQTPAETSFAGTSFADTRPAVAIAAANTGIAAIAPTSFIDDPVRARKQQLLDELKARYEQEAPHKNFVTSSDRIVFGEGDPSARLLFIGEAPGAEEERTGRPFVGRSGELLDKMMKAMGLSRSTVYICNVLKTRPPDNATPTPEEAEACKPYLYEQVGIIRPDVIVTLGLPATRTVLNSTASMGSMRGIWATFTHPGTDRFEGFSTPVMPTFHPAFVLRAYTDENRKKVWSDLQQAMVKLGLGKSAG